MRAKSRRKQRVLFVLALFLAGSSVLRIGLAATQAMARGTADSVQGDHSQETETCEAIEFSPALQALRSRETQLNNREEELRLRQRELEGVEEKIGLKLDELRQAEEALRSTVAIVDTAAERDLTRLTAVYENMKPAQAAALFEQMEPEFAAGFLGLMRPEAAAGIMAGIEPTAAYSISVILAGRNSQAPKE